MGDKGGLTLLVMKGGCDGRMEGGREGEIINELALPVTPSQNPGLEAALHRPAGSRDNWRAGGGGGGGGGGGAAPLLHGSSALLFHLMLVLKLHFGQLFHTLKKIF